MQLNLKTEIISSKLTIAGGQSEDWGSGNTKEIFFSGGIFSEHSKNIFYNILIFPSIQRIFFTIF